MNPIIKEAHELLEARRPTLRCGMFLHVVEVAHGDGSHFVFQAATAKIRKVQGNRMLLIWTEHCDYHAFFCEDLEFWKKYQIVNI